MKTILQWRVSMPVMGGLLILATIVAASSPAGSDRLPVYAGDLTTMRGLSCHACPVECNTVDNGPPVTACNGAVVEDWCDQNYYCGAKGDGSLCGEVHRTKLGPYYQCLFGTGSLDGPCGTSEVEVNCYEQVQCECNNFLFNECECGPYTYYETIMIRSGC